LNRNKLAATALLISISLSAVGFAYAAWYDVVYIKGTVDMGSLTLAFDYIEPPLCSEFFLNRSTGKLDPGEYLGKDVGYCEAWYSEEFMDEHTLKKGYKQLNIYVENAYPQYYVFTTFKLHNIGEIPINIARFDITGEKYDKDGNLIYKLLWFDPNGDYIGELWEDFNGNGMVDPDVDLLVMNLEITNKLPYQIDPCFTNKAQIDIDFKQDAEECHTYYLHVTVWGIQWNKDSSHLPTP
jgi:hypothetical protein